MLSPETLEAYRRMTPEQRLRLTLELCQSAWRGLNEGDPVIVERRYMRLAQENEMRNQRICDGLRRAEQAIGQKNDPS
jgi:hypothetical protein